MMNQTLEPRGIPIESVRSDYALGEAIDIFRTLWSGGVHSFEGDWFVVDHARLYDLPDDPIEVVVGVSGPSSVALATKKADGIMATEPNAELVEGFRKTKQGPAYAEAVLSYAESEEAGLKQAHETFRFSALGWAMNSELRDVEGFESASQFVRPEDLAGSVATGPDVDTHLALIRKYVDAGFDHVVLTCPGQQQSRFIEFFEKELRPRL
jgi:G6PDH family F420-dependent oxidoreductase